MFIMQIKLNKIKTKSKLLHSQLHYPVKDDIRQLLLTHQRQFLDGAVMLQKLDEVGVHIEACLRFGYIIGHNHVKVLLFQFSEFPTKIRQTARMIPWPNHTIIIYDYKKQSLGKLGFPFSELQPLNIDV